MAKVETCVCCGAVIPEGWQVCQGCEIKKYTFTMMPRRAGKYAYIIRQLAAHGGKIAVTRESTRRDILETAKILRLPQPDVVVITPGEKRKDPSVSLLIIDYDISKEDIWC